MNETLRWLDDFLWWRECWTEIFGAIIVVALLRFLWRGFDFRSLLPTIEISFGAILIFSAFVGERLTRTPEDA